MDSEGHYDPSSSVSVIAEPNHVLVTVGSGEHVAANFACTYDVAIGLRNELDRAIARKEAWSSVALQSQRIAPPSFPGARPEHAVTG